MSLQELGIFELKKCKKAESGSSTEHSCQTVVLVELVQEKPFTPTLGIMHALKQIQTQMQIVYSRASPIREVEPPGNIRRL